MCIDILLPWLPTATCWLCCRLCNVIANVLKKKWCDVRPTKLFNTKKAVNDPDLTSCNLNLSFWKLRLWVVTLLEVFWSSKECSAPPQVVFPFFQLCFDAFKAASNENSVQSCNFPWKISAFKGTYCFCISHSVLLSPSTFTLAAARINFKLHGEE